MVAMMVAVTVGEGLCPIALADNYHNSTRSLSAVDRPAGVQPIARGD